MSHFDLFLLLLLLAFGLWGFWFGLIHTIGSLVGSLLGIFLATRYYEPMTLWVMKITGWEGNWLKVLMFVLSFIFIAKLVGFGFWILDKITSIFTHLPVVRWLDRLAGAVLGLVEGIVIIGVCLYFTARFPLADTIMTAMGGSSLAEFFTKPVVIFLPLIPNALKFLHSTVKNIL